MAVLLECTCKLQGSRFSPALLEQVTGLTFTRELEPGPAGGAATISVPDLIPSEERLTWLAKRISPHLPLIHDAGVERMELRLALWHDEAVCTWELSRAELQALGQLGLEVTVQIQKDEAKVRKYWDRLG